MTFSLFAILIGLFPASITNTKGRYVFLCWLYGALLFIVALPHALLLAPIEKLYDSVSQPKPWHAVRFVLRQFEEKPSFVGIVTVTSSSTTLSRGRPVEGVYQIT